MKIGIIGGGRVGSCLANYFESAGMLVGITASTAAHSAALAEKFSLLPADNAQLLELADIVLLTVPDRLIAAVAQSLADSAAATQQKIVLHCSGSLGLEPLAALAAKGVHVGSLHPLQSFAGGAVQLAGVYMAVDGDAAARLGAQNLAEILQGHAFHVPARERAAYHAAACICSNYTVTVQALAQQLMSRWTGSSEAAWAALQPLFAGTAANLRAAADPADALTGPIARGDTATVAKHLAVLPGEFLPVYCSLGLAATQLALAHGTIDGTTAQQLYALLQKRRDEHGR